MKRIAPMVTPPGILGVCDLPHLTFTKPEEPYNWLYLDRLQDPGNLGTILRTADWFGLRYIALAPGCVDPYIPKVVRGGMGAHFRLALYCNISLSSLRTSTHTIIGAHHQGQALDRGSLPSAPWVLVLGNEAQGTFPLQPLPLSSTPCYSSPGRWRITERGSCRGNPPPSPHATVDRP